MRYTEDPFASTESAQLAFGGVSSTNTPRQSIATKTHEDEQEFALEATQAQVFFEPAWATEHVAQRLSAAEAAQLNTKEKLTAALLFAREENQNIRDALSKAQAEIVEITSSANGWHQEATSLRAELDAERARLLEVEKLLQDQQRDNERKANASQESLRHALQEENAAKIAEKDAVILQLENDFNAQREDALARIDAIKKEKDALIVTNTEKDEIMVTMTAEFESTLADKDAIMATVLAERDVAIADKEQVLAERDAAITDKEQLASTLEGERRAALAGREALTEAIQEEHNAVIFKKENIIEELTNERNDLFEERDQAHLEREALSATIKEQEATISDKESIIVTLTKERDTLISETKQLISAQQDKQSALATLISEKDSLSAILTKERDNLISEKEERDSLITQLKAEIQAKSASEISDNELDEARNEIATKQSAVERLEADLAAHKAVVQALRTDLEKTSAQYQALETQSIEHDKARRELESTVEQLQQGTTQAEEARDQAFEELKSTQKLIAEKEHDLATSSAEERERLSAELAQLESKLDEATRGFQSKSETLDSIRARLDEAQEILFSREREWDAAAHSVLASLHKANDLSRKNLFWFQEDATTAILHDVAQRVVKVQKSSVSDTLESAERQSTIPCSEFQLDLTDPTATRCVNCTFSKQEHEQENGCSLM